jgi:hypothetical protein
MKVFSSPPTKLRTLKQRREQEDEQQEVRKQM